MRTLVIVLQGCPIARLGAYGNEWIATPNIDRLASDSAVFDWHYSDCPSPAAARRAWRSGRHGFQPPASAGAPSPDLLETLRQANMTTAIVRANRPHNDAPAEFYAGWDKVFDARPAASFSNLDELIDRLPSILIELESSADWLLWLEIDSLLPPWEIRQDVFEVYVEDLFEEGEPRDEEVIPWADPKVGWFDREDLASWELLHRSAAAAVTIFDADFGRLISLLQSRQLDEQINMILMSDYGFALGEHGLVGPHRPYLHEEVVHLPLLIRLADRSTQGLRVSSYTQPADVMPTLLQLHGIPLPETIDGHDLRHLWETGSEGMRKWVISDWRLEGAREQSIRTESWAYLQPIAGDEEEEPRSPMLFQLPDDRGEMNNVASRNLEVVEELVEQLRQATPPQ